MPCVGCSAVSEASRKANTRRSFSERLMERGEGSTEVCQHTTSVGGEKRTRASAPVCPIQDLWKGEYAIEACHDCSNHLDYHN